MARVLPFKALRFASLTDTAGQVARLHDAPDPWAAVKRWFEAGELVAEPSSLYVVETQSADSLTRRPPVRFLLGAMKADDEGLLELERAPDRNAMPDLAPVPVLAADDHGVLRGILEEVALQGVHVWESVVDHQRLRMWRVAGGGLARRLRSALAEVPARPHGKVPSKGAFLAAVVPLSEPGLELAPYHRGLKGLATFDPGRFLALVGDYARTYELDAPLNTGAGLDAARERLATISRGQHAVLFVLPDGQGKLLRFRQGLELEHIPAVPRSPTLRSLDLALLNALVLRTVLGISDPEAPGHANVHPVVSLDELVRKVEEGVFQAGFALNPPPVWEVRAVMEAAQSLPPRTVRLGPLPPAGLLFLDPLGQG